MKTFVSAVLGLLILAAFVYTAYRLVSDIVTRVKARKAAKQATSSDVPSDDCKSDKEVKQ